MKLAVIIPTYNSLDTLKVLVGNVFDYTSGEYNLIVIEDGQRPETIEYLKSIDKPNFYPIFHEVNKGVSPSWNDGIRKAQELNSDYFAIINDDVTLPPNWWDLCYPMFSPDVHVVHDHFEYFAGWFFILDKYCLERVGYFDEQFAPFNAEDTDYQFRCEALGMKMALVDIGITHVGSNTIKKVIKEEPGRYQNVVNDNWQRLRKKYPKRRMNSPI